MLDRILEKIGKDKVFSIRILVIICMNIVVIGKTYAGYETFKVDNQSYRYVGTDGNTSKIRCENGKEYTLIETRMGEESDGSLYLEGRYNSDYILKTEDEMATYISTEDGVVMKLFDNSEFRIDDKVQDEFLKSAVSISKKNGELSYDFKYEDRVPLEYRIIESAIMYHSTDKEMINFYSMVLIPFVLTFVGILIFVYPREILNIKGSLGESFIADFFVLLMRIVGVFSIVISFYIKDI